MCSLFASLSSCCSCLARLGSPVWLLNFSSLSKLELPLLLRRSPPHKIFSGKDRSRTVLDGAAILLACRALNFYNILCEPCRPNRPTNQAHTQYPAFCQPMSSCLQKPYLCALFAIAICDAAHLARTL